MNKTCLIIIPVFNAEMTIERCIKSVLIQTYKHIKIAIINDYSTDSSLKLITKFKDKRIKVYSNSINLGCYNSINKVLCQEKNWYCFMILGSDDIIHKDRVKKQFVLSGASVCKYEKKNGNRVEIMAKYGHSMTCYSKEVFEKLGYFDNTRYGGDTEYFLRYKEVYRNIKEINEILYYASHTEKSLTEVHNQNKRNIYCAKIKRDFEEMKCKKDYYRKFIDMKVNIGVATMPERNEALKDCINSIKDQCDNIFVYCNNFKAIPEWLKKIKKVTVFDSKKEVGNLGDVGKFYGLQDAVGYNLTIDDDLIYGPDYVSKIVEGINKYRCPVSFHGKLFNSLPVQSFYHGFTEQFRCLYDVKEDVKVHIAGSGCFGWHSDMINFNVKDFENINMSDIYCSILSKKAGFELMCLSHKQGEIRQNLKVKRGIWDIAHSRDEMQTKLINDNKNLFACKKRATVMSANQVECEVKNPKFGEVGSHIYYNKSLAGVYENMGYVKII